MLVCTVSAADSAVTERLAEIEKGGGARYNGAIDSRAASGEALGY